VESPAVAEKPRVAYASAVSFLYDCTASNSYLQVNTCYSLYPVICVPYFRERLVLKFTAIQIQLTLNCVVCSHDWHFWWLL